MPSPKDIFKNLTNLKRKEDVPVAIPDKPSTEERYPWGMEIDLDTETIKTLGMDIKTMKVGDEVKIACVAKVKSLRESESENDKSQNMCLQITDMKIEE